MMQRTANENAAGLRRICKRSDQTKMERLESLASLFSKSYVCKMSSVLTETRSEGKFQNPPAGTAYVDEKLLFRDGLVWTVALP